MVQLLDMLKRQLQYATSNIESDENMLTANLNLRVELEDNLRKSKAYLEELKLAISILEKSTSEQVKTKKQK